MNMKSILATGVLLVLTSAFSGCGDGGRKSALVGRWELSKGDARGNPENMELLNDGTGIVDEVGFTWKTENGRFYITSSLIAKSWYYTVQGSTLLLTDDGTQPLEYKKKNQRSKSADTTMTKEPHGDGFKNVYRDARGNIVQESHFSADGEPCLTEDGYATVKMKYDNNGYRIQMSAFDISGKPCLTKEGIATVKMEYDNNGRQIQASVFGINGKPCLTKDGFATAKMQYNANGYYEKTSYFGIDGKLIREESGGSVMAGEHHPPPSPSYPR